MSKPTRRLNEFRPLGRNPNKHTPRGMGMLEDSIQRDGYVAPMTATADGTVIDGNARLETVATALPGDPIVVEHDGTRPVIMVRTDIPDADDPRAKRIAIAANRIGAVDLAWDPDILKELATELDLSQMFSAEELAELLGEEPNGGLTDPDAVPEERQTDIKLGDLFALGDHRLLCGDSTKAEDVARVMGGEKAALMVTDPPYGVSYADKNRFLNAIGRPNSVQEPILEDHQSPEQMSAFWQSAFTAVRTALADGASYYVTGPQGGDLLLLLLQSLSQTGYPLRHMLIWAKNQFVIGRSDYHYQHEPIIFGWVKGTHKFYGDHSQASVWQIDKPHESKLHPTMKPVELYTRALQNSSAAGDVVVEPFCGSGTAIIACDQLGRQCRAIELDPPYAQVAIDRWEQFTGKTATKIAEAVAA